MPELPVCLVAVVAGSGSAALVSFLLYLVGVFALAWLSGRQRSEGGFISEYFLGSRNLGVWAFALTFAATSASGGSFVGFPALIYTHGWVLALWIAGYMVVPLVAMALLGKRLNRVGRLADAVTIPDLIERRLGSAAAGIVATVLIVAFMFYFLLAQFQAGSKILVVLLRGIPAFDDAVHWVAVTTRDVPGLRGTEPDYLLCLTVFAGAVIVYVVYGGFRAVVWTDVMQGVIMFLGVVFLLGFALKLTGGLEAATRQLAERRPPRMARATLRLESFYDRPAIPKGTWIRSEDEGVVRAAERIDVPPSATDPAAIREVTGRVLELSSAADRQAVPEDAIARGIVARVTLRETYAANGDRPGAYIYPPGPHPTQAAGFLPLSLAFSFFVFWPFGAAGQPSNMIRLMAFRDTQTLKLSIATVAIYFSFIYFSLVIIFCCARVLLPGMEIDADRAMPEMALYSTGRMGVPWLAGFLLAAPFAAVMSSVDSFLLLVASSLVRDIYQRCVPTASERLLKKVTYLCTIAVGILAMGGALHPPQYLQKIIVDASGYLSSSLLAPVALALYWRRLNATGAIAGMLAGSVTFGLFSTGAAGQIPLLHRLHALNYGPLVWALLASLAAVIMGSLLARPPRRELVERYFD
jgi:sodium/pantothenate symporter